MLGLLAVGLLTAPGARAEAPSEPVRLEVFVREGCPRCEDAKRFLSQLQAERPELQVQYRDVVREPEALARLQELAGQRSMGALGVPAFHVAGRLIIGFSGPETTGRQLVALLEGQAAGETGGAVCPVGAEAPTCPPGAPLDTIDAPWVGRVSLKDWGLPAFTVLIGLLDGFNPCAMWVLLFLLSMVLIAVVTLGHHKLQERAGRWLKLLSGSVMVLLGLLLLLRPRWLAF